MPLIQCVLVDLPTGIAVRIVLKQSSHEFDIEDPAGQKRLGQDLVQLGRDAQQFGAALRVRNGDRQRQRGQLGKQAANALSPETAVDPPAQQGNTGAHDQLALRPLVEYLNELGDVGQGSRQIGVPITNIFRVVLKCREQSLPNRFCLALIVRQLFDGNPPIR